MSKRVWSKGLGCLFLLPVLWGGQSQSEFQEILERLDRVEKENRGLAEEIRALRQELAASRAGAAAGGTASATPAEGPEPLEDRVAIAERRIAEQAQTKVESSQRMPVSLTGMVLFNAFLNGKHNGDRQDPAVASMGPGTSSAGASLRQSVLGLKFDGPETLGGAKVSGSVYMDFFSGSSNSLNHLVRLRVASIDIDWNNRGVLFGQDKPIVAPREPTSLAQVGVSPLTGAGNLWLWGPQVRVEQRFKLGAGTSLRAQAGVYETSEPAGNVPTEYVNTLAQSRPGIEGRFELSHRWGEGAKLEVAPGFHFSKTHVLGLSVPSHLFTVDWSVQPAQKFEFTGQYFRGENAAGIGGLQQGFTVFNGYRAVPVQAWGGWAQLSWFATKRASFNTFAGQESDRASDLLAGEITRNRAYGANLIYRIGQNVLAGLEASQVRTTYLGLGNRLNNHYDLGLAYLF